MTAAICLQAGVCSARGGLPAILASTIAQNRFSIPGSRSRGSLIVYFTAENAWLTAESRVNVVALV